MMLLHFGGPGLEFHNLKQVRTPLHQLLTFKTQIVETEPGVQGCCRGTAGPSPQETHEHKRQQHDRQAGSSILVICAFSRLPSSQLSGVPVLWPHSQQATKAMKIIIFAVWLTGRPEFP